MTEDAFDRTRAFQPSIPSLEPARTCSVCGNVMWQKHAETCAGPRQRVWWPEPVQPECDCAPGAFHEAFCPIAYWPQWMRDDKDSA